MDRKYTLITIGITLWALVAVFMHFTGPILLDGGLRHIIFWIANFFLPALALPFIAKLTGRTKHDMLAPIILMATPAMALDGLSVTFDTIGLTHIYADTPDLIALNGGALLFAFASFFFWALVWHR